MYGSSSSGNGSRWQRHSRRTARCADFAELASRHRSPSAFSVHRAMDACGSLLGPIVAFVLLAALPGKFDAVWVTSFFFAVLGVAVLWLFVPRAHPRAPTCPGVAASGTDRLVSPGVRAASWRSAACGALLAATSISDGFRLSDAAGEERDGRRLLSAVLRFRPRRPTWCFRFPPGASPIAPAAQMFHRRIRCPRHASTPCCACGAREHGRFVRLPDRCSASTTPPPRAFSWRWSAS